MYSSPFGSLFLPAFSFTLLSKVVTFCLSLMSLEIVKVRLEWRAIQMKSNRQETDAK